MLENDKDDLVILEIMKTSPLQGQGRERELFRSELQRVDRKIGMKIFDAKLSKISLFSGHQIQLAFIIFSLLFMQEMKGCSRQYANKSKNDLNIAVKE